MTILYYLQKDKMLAELGYELSRSTRTIWKFLDRYHCLVHRAKREHEQLERPEPGVEWGMDFHDVSTVPADPQGKKQHMVEILKFVDHGSSALVASEPGDAYTAETALRTVARVFQEQGCPDRIDLDRDPRWVGSWTAKDFPSPLLRFLQCRMLQKGGGHLLQVRTRTENVRETRTHPQSAGLQSASGRSMKPKHRHRGRSHAIGDPIDRKKLVVQLTKLRLKPTSEAVAQP